MNTFKMYKGILFGLILLYTVSVNCNADTSSASINKAKAINARDALIKSDKVSIAQVNENYGNIPLYFIRNDGQIDEKVKYYEKGNGHSTYFTKKGVYLELTYTEPPAESSTSGHQDNLVNKQTSSSTPDHAVRHVSGGEDKDFQLQTPNLSECDVQADRKSQMIKLTPLGANKDPEIVVENKQKGRVNYFIGNDSKKWQTDIPTYKAVVYKEVYDGIDMKFYGNNRQMEYDIIVKPGADPYQVQLVYDCLIPQYTHSMIFHLYAHIKCYYLCSDYEECFDVLDVTSSLSC